MIDPAAPAASWFLWILASSFLLLYAVPLLVSPLRWARFFRWHAPASSSDADANPLTPLTRYFGRCVGAIAIAICVISLRAAPHISAHPILLEFIAITGALLAAVHAYGALEGNQPWPETAEILLFGGAAAIAAWLRMGL